MQKTNILVKLFALSILFAFSIGANIALAQYGPPAGFESTDIPEGYGPSSDPSEMDIPEGFGPPAGSDEMMKKGLEQMKKGTKGMEKAVKQMEKTIKKVQDAGYTVSAEVEESFQKGKAAVETIKNASDIDVALEAMDDFNTFIDMLDMNMEGLNMLAGFPKILKQADRTYAKLTKLFEKNKKKAQKGEVDLSGVIADIQLEVDALKAVYDKAVAAAKGGDAELAFTTLEDEYFEHMEDTFQMVGMLEAASQLSKAVKNVEKGIKSAEKNIAKFEKKDFDMTAASGIVTASRAKLDALKALLKTKEFDPDDAVSLLEELEDLRTEFEDAVEEETGKNLHGKDSVKFFNVKMPEMPKEMKDGFPKGEAGDSGFEKLDF